MTDKILRLKMTILKSTASNQSKKKYERYQGKSNLTKKQQHSPMGWQNRTEQDITAIPHFVKYS